MNPAVGLAAFVGVALATASIGFYGLRISRTTGDFYVASRTVRPWWNASAIGGEYLSAASFLGVAGLILLTGTDALWFPVGYTAGYLMLLLFVAAPLRRSGAYTIPDFTEARLQSKAVRRVTSLVVVAVGWLYIVPQLHGAGLTIRISTGLPSWVGSIAVIVVVCVTVVAGGMRSITFVQAFQYWLKLTALAVPVVFLLMHQSDAGMPALAEASSNPTGLPAAGLYQTVSLLVALLFGTLGLPTSWSASIPTLMANRRAGQPSLFWGCCLSSICSRPRAACWAVSSRPSLRATDNRMPWSSCCLESCWAASLATCSRHSSSRERLRRSSRRRRDWWCRWRASSARTFWAGACVDSGSRHSWPPSSPCPLRSLRIRRPWPAA